MSAAPDPAELAPSRDPAAYGKRPLFTAGFFAWVSLCVICVLAGAAIGRYGVPAPPAARLQPRASQAPARMPPALSPPTNPPPAAAASAGVPAADAALSDRVSRLEAASGRVGAAAASALAAASLSSAAETSGPFDQDLAAYERLAPGDPDLQALAPLAARGAPTAQALAASLPDLASQAAAAARQPAKGAGFLDRLWAMAAKVVIVRNLDPNAPGVDGVLARAQDEAAAGDLTAAVQTLRALPPAARAPLEAWLAAAGRRIEIDRRIDALRARALSALAQAAAPAPTQGPPS